MFNLFKKPINKNQKTITLKLSGLHCTSCAVNIDLSLEDIPGISKSDTNYQKSTALVSYDPTQTTIEKIIKEISALGYEVSIESCKEL